MHVCGFCLSVEIQGRLNGESLKDFYDKIMPGFQIELFLRFENWKTSEAEIEINLMRELIDQVDQVYTQKSKLYFV